MAVFGPWLEFQVMLYFFGLVALTTILEADHMPNKYIPKDLRLQLSKIIPGLRPWEVLRIELAMDQITYDGEWHREPLGSFTTCPPYIQHWNKDVVV